MTRVLFVTAECEPLIKIGGLADVSGGLPRALRDRGHDVRLLLPAYGGLRGVEPDALPVAKRLSDNTILRELPEDFGTAPGWLLDTPAFRRRRHPYHAADGSPWDDDARAFHELARVAAMLAGDGAGIGWRADVVHANEWHTALAPVELLLQRVQAASVFTIHNIAYQGVFPMTVADELGLPGWLLQPEGLEFYGRLSFMKGGLVFSDRITAVSPGYADEICTPEFGERMDGVMRARRNDLTGILNGIDMREWDPWNDSALGNNFSVKAMNGKALEKRRLLQSLDLPANDREPLLVFVGRLVAQKGVDLLLGALPQLAELPLRIAVLGTGEPMLEAALREAAERHPEKLAIRLRYDDVLARRFFAGGDLLLMPSRFEPCGLTQMYAMRYGSLPVAHAVGGLRDSIEDTNAQSIADGSATGFLFRSATVNALLDAVQRALELHADGIQWQRVMQNAMSKDFSWEKSARQYEKVYEDAMTRA